MVENFNRAILDDFLANESYLPTNSLQQRSEAIEMDVFRCRRKY